MRSPTPVTAAVFDIGGVLLDWDPRHLYRKLFDEPRAMEWFLKEICTPEWHAPHDRGVPAAESCARLAKAHPDLAEAIWAWAMRSEEMVSGAIRPSVELVAALKANGVPCYALTNMEAETYPRRAARFAFFGWFDGTVVSGLEGIVKPTPEIFRRLLSRFGLDAASTLFVDDQPDNVAAAAAVGMQVHRFRSPGALAHVLEERGLLPAVGPGDAKRGGGFTGDDAPVGPAGAPSERGR